MSERQPRAVLADAVPAALRGAVAQHQRPRARRQRHRARVEGRQRRESGAQGVDLGVEVGGGDAGGVERDGREYGVLAGGLADLRQDVAELGDVDDHRHRDRGGAEAVGEVG